MAQVLEVKGQMKHKGSGISMEFFNLIVTVTLFTYVVGHSVFTYYLAANTLFYPKAVP